MAKAAKRVMRLAEWTERVPSTASKDPLGLANRVSQRLVDQLLFGMSGACRRARYYGYYTWAIHDVLSREQPASSEQVAGGIYWRDLAYMAACLLHHSGDEAVIAGVAGARKGAPFLRSAGDPVDLATLEHIESSSEGGFGLNFKGSILNLGLCRQVYTEEESDVLYEVSAAKPVRQLVDAIEGLVKPTRFYARYACSRGPIPREVLAELGQSLCLCLLPKRAAPDRDILRDMLFERLPGFEPPHSYRPESLRLMLHCADLCSSQDIPFVEWQFRCMIYFGQGYRQDEASVTNTPIGEPFEDIRNRWRIFFLHHYFSYALEGLLVVLLNVLSEAGEAGMAVDAVIDTLETGGFSQALRELLHGSSVSLAKTSLGQVLAEAIGEAPKRRGNSWDTVAANSPLSEELLEEYVDEQIRSSNANASAGCVLLLVLLLDRCARIEGTRYWNWALNATEDPQRDVCAPIMYLRLGGTTGEWQDLSIREFFRTVIARFVIEQHEMMVPEKKRGTAWLSWSDGLAFFENAFRGPSPGTSRFGTADQVLCDLGLLSYGDEGVPQLRGQAPTLISEMVADRETEADLR